MAFVGSPASFFVQNFGCRAAQADGAALEAALQAKGFAPAGRAAAADVVVLNTCTVTAAADEDARQAIRRIHRENPRARILVTGCYAQRAPLELAALPGVSWVVGNSHKHLISDLVPIQPLLNQPGPADGEPPAAAPRSVKSGLPQPVKPLDNLSEECGPDNLEFHGQILVGDISSQHRFLPVLGSGASEASPAVTFDRTRPILKIQDGCDSRCSFCIIPSVRGRSRSAPPELVLEQARVLASQYREIVISGINLGRWGQDLPGRPRLAGLLRVLLEETSAARLRLSSVEPMDWTDELLRLMAGDRRMARHIHAPLQSGSDRILRKMHRRYRAHQYAERIEKAYTWMPEAAFGADVMVGFPGETEADFEQTYRLIEELPFTYLHVFTYSPRPSTPAAELADQAPAPVKRERNRVLRELAQKKGEAFRRRWVGKRLSAITLDDSHPAGAVALSENYIKVLIPGVRLPGNQIVEVEGAGLDGEFLTARN
jgi:threonylcarbamoyladenosine tRNA methylthiotransferase MtaB